MRLPLLALLFAAALLTGGCNDDEVKVHRSYEGSAPRRYESADDGRGTITRQETRAVSYESEDWDDDDEDDREVKIHRSERRTTTHTEEVVVP
jgi:hypothetical protein